MFLSRFFCLAVCLTSFSACTAKSVAATDSDVVDTLIASDSAGDTNVVDSASDVSATATWRDSLKICWTDLSCKRAFVISHGGDWSLADFPYDSEGAFHRAFDKGADGIKTDVHVTKDNVAVVAHSSPILGYESPDCGGQKIEEMTADEVTKCHILSVPQGDSTFQRLDTVLEWARGKVIIMLTVKESKDFPRAIQTVIEHNALDYVFLETSLGDLQNAIPLSPDWKKSWYNAEVDSPNDVTLLTETLKLPQVAFCEVNVKYQEAENETLPKLLAEKIHPAGMRGFVSSIHLPEVAQHEALWNAGFDVIMTYTLDNAMEARRNINTARGISPP